MEKQQIEPVQLFTRENINVTGRIKTGKTVKFLSRKEAEEYAKMKRSYVYDLMYRGQKETLKFYGYAVPN